MFYWIGFQSRNTGARAVTNHLRENHGLRILQIAPAHTDADSELVEVNGDVETYNFPANCVIEVFIGPREPEPIAIYVAQVVKV